MEAEKESLTLSLTTEEVYKDIKKSMEISDKIKEVDDKIKDHYEEWELLLMEEEEA